MSSPGFEHVVDEGGETAPLLVVVRATAGPVLEGLSVKAGAEDDFEENVVLSVVAGGILDDDDIAEVDFVDEVSAGRNTVPPLCWSVPNVTGPLPTLTPTPKPSSCCRRALSKRKGAARSILPSSGNGGAMSAKGGLWLKAVGRPKRRAERNSPQVEDEKYMLYWLGYESTAVCDPVFFCFFNEEENKGKNKRAHKLREYKTRERNWFNLNTYISYTPP